MRTSGQPCGAILISESGLYKLIMRSDKPQARAFQDWVTCDVFPAIRKDGIYVMGEEKVHSGELNEDVLNSLGRKGAPMVAARIPRHFSL